MGRVLLAGLSPRTSTTPLAELDLHSYTETTVHDVGELRRALDVARDRGYAIVDQELEHGLRSAAAPVRDDAGVGDRRRQRVGARHAGDDRRHRATHRARRCSPPSRGSAPTSARYRIQPQPWRRPEQPCDESRRTRGLSAKVGVVMSMISKRSPRRWRRARTRAAGPTSSCRARPSTSAPAVSSRSAARSTATRSAARSWPSATAAHKLPIKADVRKADRQAGRRRRDGRARGAPR